MTPFSPNATIAAGPVVANATPARRQDPATHDRPDAHAGRAEQSNVSFCIRPGVHPLSRGPEKSTAWLPSSNVDSLKLGPGGSRRGAGDKKTWLTALPHFRYTWARFHRTTQAFVTMSTSLQCPLRSGRVFADCRQMAGFLHPLWLLMTRAGMAGLAPHVEYRRVAGPSTSGELPLDVCWSASRWSLSFCQED